MPFVPQPPNVAGLRFNPPPGWPPADPNWMPPPGWQAAADLPEAPPGWQWYVPVATAGQHVGHPRQGNWFGRHKVLTGMGAVVAVLVIGGIAAGAGGSNNDGSGTRTANSSSVTADKKVTSQKSAPKKSDVAKAGTTVADGNFHFTVTKVKAGVASVGDEYLNKKAQGQFIEIYVTVRNTKGDARTFDSSSQYVYDAKGNKYSADDEAGIYLDNSNSFLNDINPGNSVSGILVYDIPKGVTPSYIELHDSPFSGGVKVALP